MNKVLIALHNRKLQALFRDWITEEEGHDLLLLAKNPTEAMKLVTHHKIAFVVTELSGLNAHDGFDLLAFLKSHAPGTQVCTLVNTTATSNIEIKHKHINSLKMLKKPKRLTDVVAMMSLLVENHFNMGTAADISLAEIFKLIEIEKKLCVLEVKSPGIQKKGFLYFERGILYDAFWDYLNTESAVLEMLTWKEFAFNFKNVPLRQLHRKIKKPLDEIISSAK